MRTTKIIHEGVAQIAMRVKHICNVLAEEATHNGDVLTSGIGDSLNTQIDPHRKRNGNKWKTIFPMSRQSNPLQIPLYITTNNKVFTILTS